MSLFSAAIRHLGMTGLVIAGIASTIAGATANAQTGRVAYYPFDGSAADATGNGHGGVVHGAQPTVDRFGRLSAAYYFDGGSYIAVPHAGDLAFGAGSAYTISAWIRTCTSQGEYAGVVVKGPRDMRYPGYQLVVMRSTRIGMQVGTSGGDYVETFGTSPLNNAVWRLLTLTVDHRSNTVRLYVDAKLEATVQVPGMNTSIGVTDSLLIGVERNHVRYFRGSIDDVSLYSRVLSQTEIDALYREGGFLPAPVPRGRVFTIGLCSGEDATLTIPVAAPSYSWSTGQTTRSIRVSAAGTYFGTGIDDQGCTTVDTFMVDATPAPLVSLVRNLTICSGQSVVIGAPATGGTPPYRYSWSPTATLDDPASATPTAAPTGRVVYHVVITDSRGCTTVDSVTVDQRPGIAVDVNGSATICRGASSSLRVNVLSGSGPFTYEWTPGDGLDSSNIPTPTATPTQTTRYIVTVTGPDGCVGRDTITVSVNDGPVADAGPSRVICSGSASITIGAPATGGTPPYSYAWSPSVGLSSTTESTPTAAPTASTQYTVVVTDANGCRDTATTFVDVSGSILELEPSEVELGAMLYGERRCDTVVVRNRGSAAVDISTARMFVNRSFSIPPSQYPLILEPGESRRLVVCFHADVLGEIGDTMAIDAGCFYRIVFHATVGGTMYGTDDCNVRLRFRADTALVKIILGSPTPNPASGRVSVPVEVISASGGSPVTAGIFDIHGHLVASGEFVEGMSVPAGVHVRTIGTIDIGVSSLPSGAYLLRVTGASVETSAPIIIQH